MYRKSKRKSKHRIIVLLVTMLFLLIVIVVFAAQKIGDKGQNISSKKTSSSSSMKTSSTSNLSRSTMASSPSPSVPETASKSDWQLVLVNLMNKKPEMNPELATVDNIQVDTRIVPNVEAFLAAARQIDPQVHLISGYRSVAYQASLFNSYVLQTMAANPAWTKEEATKEVMKTSQPPEASEHETGLAVDMSAVNALNEENPTVASQIAALAPNYGFILRFPSWGTASTGIDYEDWHFRYVGEVNAKYITNNQLTLEEFLGKLSK